MLDAVHVAVHMLLVLPAQLPAVLCSCPVQQVCTRVERCQSAANLQRCHRLCQGRQQPLLSRFS